MFLLGDHCENQDWSEVGTASAAKSTMAVKAPVPGKCSESKSKSDQVM